MALQVREISSISTKAAYVTPPWTKIEFPLFLIGQLLSNPCYLFVIYHILANKTAQLALHSLHLTYILLSLHANSLFLFDYHISLWSRFSQNKHPMQCNLLPQCDFELVYWVWSVGVDLQDKGKILSKPHRHSHLTREEKVICILIHEKLVWEQL